MCIRDSPSIDPKALSKRVAKIIKAEIANHSRIEALRKILSVIDLTSLKGDEKEDDILALCTLARSFANEEKGIPPVAAICIYPPHIPQAADLLSDTDILLATVAGGFPDGNTPTALKVEEVREAVKYGADEIDMVMNYALFLEGKYEAVSDDIATVKSVCRDIDLKVILETGKLGSPDNIRKASEIAIEAGADFLKTSTGKTEPAATLEALLVMSEVVKEYYDQTGIIIGLKPAGGIREPLQAFHYLSIVYHILGGQWLSPDFFRIGASQLAVKVFEELQQS
jgi:deoxyribose-phosphate aldolase